MKKIAVSFLILTFIVSNAQFPQFKSIKMGETDEDLLGQTSLTDLDNDGDLDFIVGSNYGTIWWFEYVDGTTWKKHVLGEGSMTFMGGTAYDVDNDGFTDQVSGHTWFKNPGKTGHQFTKFDNNAIIAYDNIHADLDGDGKMDLVSLSEEEGLYIYLSPDKPEKKWKGIKIADGVAGGIAPHGIADLNGDKKPDIIRSNMWFENTGNMNKWYAHPSFVLGESVGKYAHSMRVWAVDMDNDGDNDVVASEMNAANGKIAWFENKDVIGTNWYMHKIDYNTLQDLHSLAVYDFDNDGDLDVFSGGARFTKDFHKRCFIWENVDGAGEKWERHEILVDVECHEAQAADVDGDGDIDICVKPWKGTTCIYLKNMLIDNKN